MKKINYKKLKYKSQVFVGLVLDKAESLISTPGIPVEPKKNVTFRNNFVFSDRQGNKFVTNLN